jgi:hypothetical protein
MTCNALVLVALGLAGLPALAEVQPKDRKVSVHLSFSEEEYDPTRPSKAVMRCVVQNDTTSGVHVPVGFDGGYVRVESGGLTLYKRRIEKDDVKLAWVEPGKQQMVFELPLDDLLVGAAKREGVWHWTWQRRPAPPPSPIHKFKEMGFVDQASFKVTLDLGGRTFVSEAASLKVKPGP